ncbi:hypothetical protein PVL29_022928 [Vitis rotundifolia]|uniref:DUF4408 domain-containing protein n=1 Tax=Vitis rotundifolia TaxID=103349 RepID=A0AA38YWW7_VITRO|nr:hypothetical protein PVL29_022928 [Vitis rotundifolia]
MASDMFWKSSSNSISRFHMAIWVVKQTLLSLGIISTVLMLKPTPKISYIFNLLCCSVPSIWVWLRSWLSPPYVYITINVILILIIVLVSSSSSSSFTEKYVADSSPEASCVLDSGEEEESGGESIAGETAAKSEKHAVTALIHGWEDQNETLDATWKEIMEEDGNLSRRQLGKSDSWDEPPGVDGGNLAPSEIRKTNTFAEALSSLRETPYIRKDELLSHDQLNKQVELFIRKCRNEMRLERLESDQRLMDLLNRGM